MYDEVDSLGVLFSAAELKAAKGVRRSHQEDKEYAELKRFVEQRDQEVLATHCHFGSDGFPL